MNRKKLLIHDRLVCVPRAGVPRRGRLRARHGRAQALPGRRALPPHRRRYLGPRRGPPRRHADRSRCARGLRSRLRDLARRRPLAVDRHAVLRLLDDGARRPAGRGRHREDARAAHLGHSAVRRRHAACSSSISTPTASRSTSATRTSPTTSTARRSSSRRSEVDGRSAVRARRDRRRPRQMGAEPRRPPRGRAGLRLQDNATRRPAASPSPASTPTSRGREVMIYDDMIRTGSSLVQAARAYLAAGATRGPRDRQPPRLARRLAREDPSLRRAREHPRHRLAPRESAARRHRGRRLQRRAAPGAEARRSDPLDLRPYSNAPMDGGLGRALPV